MKKERNIVKNTLTGLVLLLLIVCIAITGGMTAENAGQIMDEKSSFQEFLKALEAKDQPKMDEKSFLQEFSKALEAKDQPKMEELVKLINPYFVFKVVLSQSDKWFRAVAEGRDGSIYINTAGAMALAYAQVFKKAGLVELVRTFGQYTQEMCKERLKGDGLIEEGFGFYEKSKWREAQNRWAEALKIYQKLRDAVGESKCLTNIGIVYSILGQYKEALEYYRQSLEISRRIGDVAGETVCLTNIGNVYDGLGQYKEALEYYRQSLEISRRIGDVAGESIALASTRRLWNITGSLLR